VIALFSLLLGCFLGGTARYFVSGVVGRRIGETFPWGTMTVNVLGCFLIGSAAGAAWGSDPDLWRPAVTGFLGSFTTVSSFSLQTLALARDGERRWAVANAVGSMALSIPICLAGLGVGRWLAGA